MNEIQIFNNSEFGEIRTLMIDNEPYFVGKDVAKSLGYSNPQKAVRDHVEDEDETVNDLFTVNGTRGILINESGLYSLILSSKLPTAKKFKRWVTSEVLPSIRKHGAYMTEETLEKALTSPDFLIKLATQLKEEQEKRKQLESIVIHQEEVIKAKDEKLEKCKPFVQFAIKLQNTNNTVSMEQAAKILKEDNIEIGRNTLFKLLREHKILMENNSPYQRYIDLDLFKITAVIKEDKYSKEHMYPVTRVTGKGLIFLNKKLREWFGMNNLEVNI